MSQAQDLAKADHQQLAHGAARLRAELSPASLAQNEAARPDRSVWVSANAGSGKTRVLTNRVARLLLAGAPPPRILCITYTKAAAAEMRARLFRTLGAWALASDAELSAALNGLLAADEPSLGADALPEARRLFARALETPGGLKIQTIHGFCERLLSRFPLESGVSPHFSVVDDARAADLLDKARDEAVRARPDRPVFAAALETLFTRTDAPETFDALLGQALRRRRSLERLDASGDALAGWLGLGAERDPAEIAAGWARGERRDGLAQIADAFAASSSKSMRAAADAVRAAAAETDPRAALRRLRGALFKKDGAPKTDKFPTADARAAAPWLEAAVRALQDRVGVAEDRLRGAERYVTSLAVAEAAREILGRVEELKAERALLDYDDLIERAVALLTRSDAREWVRYKLDGGIEHVLVDEAQDTSEAQWSAIAALVEEFFSETAETAHRAPRTVFAVGDEKQSIYSFQGAAPALLAAMGARIGAEAEAAGRGFSAAGLDTSFRSAPEILRFVDAVFEPPEARDGLAFGERPVAHVAHRAGAPGLVEIWPLVTAEEAAGQPAWDEPVDARPPDDPQARLADQVARAVSGWIGRDLAGDGGAPVRAGDILILVRKRGALSNGIIRRLKQLGAPVAGQDRLSVTSALAVRDLLALARFCLNPDDDLTLATLLRSPFCDVDEDALFELAHHRRGGRRLFYELQARREARAEYGRAYAFLAEMIRRADFQRPFELFGHALGALGGRARLIARLGREAEDPLDELLALALRFEGDASPSLERFVAAVASREEEVKREADQDRDEVRVMTAHGAKGLEAKVVVLPDTCGPATGGGRQAAKLLDPDIPGAPPIWLGRSGEEPDAVAALRDAAAAREAEEHRRLLYVALTRAEDRLVICGATRRAAGAPEGSWYALAQAAAAGPLADLGASDADGVWRYGRAAEDAGADPPAVAAPLGEQPDADPPWLRLPAPVEIAPSDIRPSAVGGGHASGAAGVDAPAADERRAALRGEVIHKLLERLPGAADPDAAAREAFAVGRGAFEPDELAAMRAEAEAVVAGPHGRWLFGGRGRAEVPVTAVLPELGPGEVRGVIDRLVVAADAVWVVDFKTGAVPTQTPEAYLRQLAVYARAASRLFPDRPARAALLWTATNALAHVSESELAAAFERAAAAVDTQRQDAQLQATFAAPEAPDRADSRTVQDMIETE